MAQSLDRLFALLQAWSDSPHHWVVLSGDRQTGKSSLLHAMADAAYAHDRPFVLWELPDRDAGGPWELLDDPASLVLLDDWPVSYPDLQPAGPLPGHGVIAVPHRIPQPNGKSWPISHWPFAATDTVVWLTLSRPTSPDGPLQWWASGAVRAQGAYRLPFPTYHLGSASFLRIFGARSSVVYAYPACLNVELGPNLERVWKGPYGEESSTVICLEDVEQFAANAQ